MNAIFKLIGDAQAPADLWRIVREYYGGLGFKGLAYFASSRGSSGDRKGFHIFHHGFSRAVKRVYIDEGLGSDDPLPAIALSRGAPVRWRKTWQEIEPDADQLYFFERIKAEQLGDGYTLPVFGPSGRNGCILTGNVTDELVEQAPVEEMHLIAQAAHMRLCWLLPDRPALEKPLSARELEILDWVARGKSNSVIADILHLSGATVDTYLRRIYEKLEVSDRTSAAVRGVGMGLITA
ncbi:MAG: LuxR family transcriptional regulator [Sphingobium sp.]